jgi:hypothetical protein
MSNPEDTPAAGRKVPLIQGIKNDKRGAEKIRIPWWGVLLWMAGCGLIDWLLISLGKFDLALPSLNSIAVVGFTIALKRKLWPQAWFWVLDHHDGPRGAPCPVGSVCSVDQQVGSGNGDC